MAAVGTIHQPPCVCFCFFLNQDFLVISLEKKKMCWGGGGVGAGGRSEGGGVATFFLFTRISTPDTPRLAPPPPPPSCLASAAGSGSVAGLRGEGTLPDRPLACTSGLDSPRALGRPQPALSPGPGPSGGCARASPIRSAHTSHTHTHTPPLHSLTHTFCSHPAPFAPQTRAAPPATLKKKKKQAYT